MTQAPSPRLASPRGSWPSEPATGRGRSHGTSSAEPFDRWFRYPAGFASDYVRLLVDRLGLEEGVLIDCFMGTGVTGTAARSRGLAFAGIEAHPLIFELAELKLSAEICADELLSSARLVAACAPVPPTDETELVSRSFSDPVLADLVGMREAIKQRSDSPNTRALKWALLGTLRDVAAVKVGWPYQRPDVPRMPRHKDPRSRFLARAALIASDVQAEQASDGAPALVLGDSSVSANWAAIPQSHGCITSPPYLNNFDYADATRLELYFWGDIRTWRQMCDDVRGNMLVATTQQSSVRAKTEALHRLTTERGDVGARIARLTTLLAAARVERGGRTKEYDQVLPAYFVAMADVLTNLITALEPESRAIWLVGDSAPYGVHIDTPSLIAEVAASVGFQPEEDVLLRRRGDRWGRGRNLSERMVVLRKL